MFKRAVQCQYRYPAIGIVNTRTSTVAGYGSPYTDEGAIAIACERASENPSKDGIVASNRRATERAEGDTILSAGGGTGEDSREHLSAAADSSTDTASGTGRNAKAGLRRSGLLCVRVNAIIIGVQTLL